MVIGQAFSAAYKQFLRSSGISEQNLEQAEYAHILNAQSVPKLEVESLGDRNKIRKVRTDQTWKYYQFSDCLNLLGQDHYKLEPSENVHFSIVLSN